MPDKFVISVSHAKNGTNKATVAFTAANAVIASGRNITVYLSLEAVCLSQAGYADDVHDEGFAPLKELMMGFAEAGGQILVCPGCFSKCQLDENILVPGAVIARRSELAGFMLGACSCGKTALRGGNDAEPSLEAFRPETTIAEERFFTPANGRGIPT